MTKLHFLILATTLFAFGLLVFSPHFSYPYPFHVDEWHHLAEAKRLASPADYFNWLQAEPGRATSGLEIGFQTLILLLSKIFDIIKIYKFLPALWAIFSGLALFFVAYQKSAKNFFVAWLALIFFMTIRTNTNLTGLWFFTPFSFSFPFIFLYTYFLSEGILLKNRRYQFYGLALMLGLTIFHPLSVLFSIPIFVIFLAINYRYVLKERRLWLMLLALIIFGFGFFALIFGLGPIKTVKQIFEMLQFSRGWGVLELNNSPFEIYPWLAWLWALAGMSYLFQQKLRAYSFYLLWPTILICSTLIYRLIGVSYFSPFQRNLYYLTLALPLFSSYGLYYFTQKTLPEQLSPLIPKRVHLKLIGGVLIGLTFFISFWGYFNQPRTSRLYRVITKADYQTLQFLAQKPKTVVMSTPFFGTALIATTHHEPVGATAFYGQRQKVESFYLKSNCQAKRKLMESTKATIIYWPKTLKIFKCSWFKPLYESDNSYLFTIKTAHD